MSYAFQFENHGTFTPDGKADIPNVSQHNQEVESVEIERIKAGEERLFLYIGKKPMIAERPDRQYYCVQTWLGTWLGWCWLGERRYMGFGHHSYRRAVTVLMFGVLYHGWYMDSSGDYCRLRKAKNQAGKYGATEVK